MGRDGYLIALHVCESDLSGCSAYYVRASHSSNPDGSVRLALLSSDDKFASFCFNTHSSMMQNLGQTCFT